MACTANLMTRRGFVGAAAGAVLLVGVGAATRGSFASADDATGDDDDAAGAPSVPALHVEGTWLVDEDGVPVQLRGISTHGLAWYPEYVNEACFRQLHDEWGATVVRLALYTEDSGGWCTDGDCDELRAVIDRGVQAAVACGLYVIIDWHILSDGDPRTHLEEACDFFDEMCRLYGELPNVLYEICNEPNGDVSWADVCEYAEEVIPRIRAAAPDAVVLVGTPNWSQQLDDAVVSPLTCDDNLMYTLHFYAATHGDGLRATLESAVEDGLPVFVSEFGICDASGAGDVDDDSADDWIDLMDDLGVSYVAWNLSNKDETSAILLPDCAKTSDFDDDDLSESGEWVVDMLQDKHKTDWDEDDDQDEGEEDEEKEGDESSPEASGAFLTASGVNVEWALRGSWMEDGRHFGNFDVTMTNNSGAHMDGWILVVHFGQRVKLVNCWNGTYHECGTRIVAVNKHYNGDLPDGSTTGGIGFIVSADSAPEIQDIEVQPS